MTFIPLPNGVQLCFLFAAASQQFEFCLSLRKSSGSPTTTDLENIGDAAKDWWTGSLKSIITTGTTLGAIRVTDMTTQGGPQHTEVVNENGSDSNPPVILGTAINVSGRTNKRGRSYRGRTYIGGFSTNLKSTAVDMTSLAASGLAASFGVLQAALDALGFDMVVASRQHNGVPTNPAELNEITAWVVDTHFDSQRRRLAGRGT